MSWPSYITFYPWGHILFNIKNDFEDRNGTWKEQTLLWKKIRSNFLAMKVNIDIAYNPHHNRILKMIMLIRDYAFLFSKYSHIYLQSQFLQFSVMNWERQDSCYVFLLERQQSGVKETMYGVFKAKKFFIITQAHLIRLCIASLHFADSKLLKNWRFTAIQILQVYRHQFSKRLRWRLAIFSSKVFSN